MEAGVCIQTPWTVQKIKSVSCPAGGQNCGQSGGRKKVDKRRPVSAFKIVDKQRTIHAPNFVLLYLPHYDIKLPNSKLL